MTKQELQNKTDEVIQITHDALQLVYDELNNGQQKKLLKNDSVAALLERYGVEVSA